MEEAPDNNAEGGALFSLLPATLFVAEISSRITALDLCRLSQCSSALKRVAEHPLVWQRRCPGWGNRLPQHIAEWVAQGKSWKEVYRLSRNRWNLDWGRLQASQVNEEGVLTTGIGSEGEKVTSYFFDSYLSFQALKPMSRNMYVEKEDVWVSYIEIELHECPDGMLGLGLATHAFPRDHRFVGWATETISFALHGDLGLVFTPCDPSIDGRGRGLAPYPWKAGDTVGMGIVFDEERGGIYWTHNGDYISRQKAPHSNCSIMYSFANDRSVCTTARGEAKAEFLRCADKEVLPLLGEHELFTWYPTISAAPDKSCRVGLNWSGPFRFDHSKLVLFDSSIEK